MTTAVQEESASDCRQENVGKEKRTGSIQALDSHDLKWLQSLKIDARTPEVESTAELCKEVADVPLVRTDNNSS